MTESPSVSDAAQRSANARKNSFFNYESPALTAELQAHGALTREHPTSNVRRPIFQGHTSKFRIANCPFRIWDGGVIRGILCIIEIALLSVLILATRCANYQDLFVPGNVYFVDAACFARMTRGRMWAKRPGLSV